MYVLPTGVAGGVKRLGSLLGRMGRRLNPREVTMLTSARFLLLCAAACLATAPASAEKKYGPGVSDTRD